MVSWTRNLATRIYAVPAPAMFIISGVSNYVGAGIAAAILFSFMPPYTAAWYRSAITALILLAWRRPFRRGLTWKDVANSALFGIATIAMNMIFYEAFARIALGATVSLEFLGPIIVAVCAGRGLKVRVATVLAVIGVFSIGGLAIDITDPTQQLGMVCAILAGVCWAGYIVLGTRIAHARSGIDSLAIGLGAGSVLTFPIVASHITSGFTHGVGIFLLIVVVAILSSLLPYCIDQIVMHKIGSDAFSVMLSLMPAVSTVVAFIVLHQIPNLWEILGIICVSCAVALVNYRRGGRIKRVPQRTNLDTTSTDTHAHAETESSCARQENRDHYNTKEH